MKKQLLIIGITLVLLVVGLSGCISQKTKGDNSQDKINFLGKWLIEDDNEYMVTYYDFYDNDTLKVEVFFYNYSGNITGNDIKWGDYYFLNNKLYTKIYVLNYSFNNNFAYGISK